MSPVEPPMTEMTPAEAVFFAAAALPTADRVGYLARACAGNNDLRQQVERMLAARAELGEFLNPPASPEKDEATLSAPATDSAATRSFAAEERPGVLIAGRYKLLQRIGEGGMGTVWMADQVEPVKRRVAVKLIREERGHSKTILSRFEAERQAIALMDHPHIAKLLDAGTSEAGQPFFVMELVKGVPLTDYCDTHRLSIPDRLTLFAQICSAVQHAHQKGVIHRDLKPTNILVESHDGRAVPKVIDFGLAKATSGLHLTDHTLFTAFGSVMGTPLYMAPEQATFNAVDVDTRADVYAMGVILYELLCGTTPLTRETVKAAALDEMLQLIREQEAPPPSSRLSATDARPSIAANRQTEPAKLSRLMKGELDWIVLRALAKERERRYESAAALARDVGRHLTGEAVEACPPTLAYRLRKAYRRNKAAVWVSTAFTLLMTVGVAVASLLAVRARDAEAVAKTNAEQASENEAAALRAEAETKQERDRVAASERTLARTLYASRLNSLQVAYEANDVERAIQIHQSMIPRPGQPDLRGFEWHYWSRQFRTDKTFFTPPDAEGSATCFVSPDGTRIGVLRRTERQSKNQPATDYDLPRASPLWMEPTRLATIEMYEAVTGKPITGFRSPRVEGHGESLPIISSRFSQDGRTVHLTLSKSSGNVLFKEPDFRFCDIDASTGKVLADKALPQLLDDGFVLIPANMKFSRDHKIVALVAQKSSRKRPERGQPEPKQPGKVEYESRIELRSWPDGALIRRTKTFPEKVQDSALSPDGSRVVVNNFRSIAEAASAKTYSFQVFHGPEWAEQTTIEEPNVSTVQLAAVPRGLEFSRDGEMIHARAPVGNGSLGIVSWDAASGKRKGNPIKFAEELEFSAAPHHRFSPNGQYVAVHRSSKLEVYTVRTGKLYSKLNVTNPGLNTPEWTADNKRLFLLTRYPRATVQSWSVDNLPSLETASGGLQSAMGSLLGQTVMGATREGKWLLRKQHLPARQGTEPETYLHPYIATRLDDPNAAEVKFPIVGCFTPTTVLVGDHFAVAYDTLDKIVPPGRERRRLAVVDLLTGKPCFETSVELPSPSLFSSPVLNTSARFVGLSWRTAVKIDTRFQTLQGEGPYTFRLWDTKTGGSVWERTFPAGAFFDATFSPNGQTLAISVGDSVRLLNPETGEERRGIERPTPQTAELSRSELKRPIEFTPDGKRVAVWWPEKVNVNGGVLVVYETASGVVVSRTEGIRQPTSMSFHPDGVRLLVSDKLIDTEIGQVMMDFPAGGLLGWTDGGRKLLGLNPGVGDPRKWLFEIDATPLK